MSGAVDAPAHLTDLVTYQDGAVVSRVLGKHDAGSLTLFAFDAGQELSEHTTPHHAYVQVLEGQADIAIGGVQHRLTLGEALLLPADVPHAVQAPVRFKMLLTMLRVPRG
jgi:quercetin dioxygenase-like cupin family protein